MIAARRYDYDRIRQLLEHIGCRDSGKVLKAESQPHALWVTPWDHAFLVPMEFCTDWEFEQMLKREFDGTRPTLN